VYSTRLHVYTRASLTDILARKSARVGQVGGQVGGLPCVPPQADFRTRIQREDPRAEVGEDVRVGVGVGPMEFKLKPITPISQHWPSQQRL